VTALFLNLADMAVIQLVAELHANGQVALDVVVRRRAGASSIPLRHLRRPGQPRPSIREPS
jgi:hypothetical protein